MPKKAPAIPEFDLWLEFEHWQTEPNDDPEDEFCNIRFDIENGESYALNVWTFKFLERMRRINAETGEYLSGEYLVTPDLLVPRLDRPTLERIVTDLIESKQLNDAWVVGKSGAEEN